MKVLFLSQEFPPDTAWGGIATYTASLGGALARLGVEVHVLSVVPGQTRAVSVIDGVVVHRCPLRRPRGLGRATRLPLTWDRVSLATAVVREHRKLGVDFDVCESPEWKAEGLGMTERLPVVVRSHLRAADVFHYLGVHGPDTRLAAGCENALLRRARIITGTSAQLNSIATAVAIERSRMRTINLPVPLPEVPSSSDGVPRVVFVGRFEDRKNPDVVLRAAPAVLERVPDARFVFVGRDTGTNGGQSYLAAMRRRTSELAIDAAVDIEDRWADRAEVQRVLESATVCVVPSRWETFGMVAAEAAALARPVVASDIPALREVVVDGETGMLAPADDAAAWGRAIAELLIHPARARELGRAGARRVAERYDPDLIARQTLEVYQAAMSWRPPSRRSRTRPGRAVPATSSDRS